LFGVGVGWNREELANVSPVPWPRRFEAMRETIAALREVWAKDVASYDGEFVKFTPSWSYPKPTRSSGPPILLGLHGPLGLRHVAAYADEWLPAASRLGDLREGFEAFRAAVEAAGRDPASIPISLVCFSPPSVETIESYANLGVQRIVLLGPDEADPYKRFADAFQPILEQFAS
jgi:alkanesulfonate monooxygenase SsuD/methylene tetrahydromethanopterin reductase-like flavin-dependent oxidoreductase (luciferase family)